MPLRDHFRSPVNAKHSWDEVHGLWPGMMVRELFDILPPGYQAAPNIHLGSSFELDVSTFEEDADVVAGSGGSTEVLATPAPTLTVEANLAEQDEYEVLVYDASRGRQLVAAVEIVSPSNKDRPESREVFVGKVAALLQKDVCVSLVDLVSIRQANLYAELLALFRCSDPQLAPLLPHLYAVTLRTRKAPKRGRWLDAWFYPMPLGQPLPQLPLWLNPATHVMLPLESSYQETCRLLRIA